MSKNVKATQATTLATEITLEHDAMAPTLLVTLKEYMEYYANVSLRRLANHFDDLSYPMMLKASKKPVKGQAWDPDAINYDALQEYIAGKLIDYTTIPWKLLDAESVATSKASLVKDMDAFVVGTTIYIRKFPTTPFTIVYRTETHIVILAEGSTEPHMWNNSTFLFQGPVFQPRIK